MKISHNKTKLAAFASAPLLALAITIIISAFSQHAMAQNLRRAIRLRSAQ
jgi:hypothetical protein